MRCLLSSSTALTAASIGYLLSLVPVAAGVTPFDDWAHQRVNLPNVSIALRYHGTGPPLLLVHGYPEHSLTWQDVGPILAQNYTVIACDNRGMGDSSIPANGDYSAETAGDDLKGVLDFLKINQTYIFGHDKGTGLTTALAAKYRSLVKRVGVSEYPLPGFGYEEDSDPSPTWSLYSNWQLAFFSVPDAAEYFITGKVKEMLSWYFFHSSYSGTEAISEDTLNRYTTQLSKPGFLRSGLQYFSVTGVDATFFNITLRPNPLTQPTLFLGGEASLAPASAVSPLWSPVARNLVIDIVPKAGHWIADENPVWVANRIAKFLAEDENPIPSIDLSYLTDQVSLV